MHLQVFNDAFILVLSFMKRQELVLLLVIYSHLFIDELLEECFHDLPVSFLLISWYHVPKVSLEWFFISFYVREVKFHGLIFTCLSTYEAISWQQVGELRSFSSLIFLESLNFVSPWLTNDGSFISVFI